MCKRVIAIAGSGAVARALGKALQQSGVLISCVASRTPEHATSAAAFIGGDTAALRYEDIGGRASHVIIAVTDRAIPDVAQAIAKPGSAVRVALHTCGAYGADALSSMAAIGVSCGGLHPLQTLRDPDRGAAALRIATFAVCGAGPALAWADELARALSGRAIYISDAGRPLYHAAAVMASNYVAALLDAAEELMVAAGVARTDALPALAPLVQTGIDNVLNRGAQQALTGPVVRGDAETVARHLNAMQHAGESIVELYRSAGLHALDMARRRGLGKEDARRVRNALLGRE